MASELIPVPDDLGFEPTIRGLETKQRVFGRYVLRRILGRGGMGIVWLSHDERLDRDVALKFLPDAINFDPSALDDLKRETRRCLELTHPNIIRIYDFVTDEQAAAISMEYIDGQTLASLRIEQPTRVFEVGDLRNWMIKACHALHYAHEDVGVVHRDLKPANFMLTGRGQMKVADFGIAQSVCDSMSRLTMRRSSSGTLAYMSPQQLNGDMAKPSDDIYALGATIYEMLTGKPPFHSGDVPFQVRLSVPKSMAEKRQELEVSGEPIPLAWEEAVASCLAKIPEERPATMGDLAERLRQASPTRRLPSLPARPSTPLPDNIRQSQKRSEAMTQDAAAQRQGSNSSGTGIKMSWIYAASAGLAILLVILVALLLPHRASAPRVSKPTFVTSAPVVLAPKTAPASPLAALPVPATIPVSTGELRVTSDTSTAVVQIDGQPEQKVPAVFVSLSPGNYQLSISADGYQTHLESVNVGAGAKIDLGNIALTRFAGNLGLKTVPDHAHYVLTGTGPIQDVRKEGTTPDYLPALPAGSYQITLTKEGSPTYNGTLVAQDHSTETLTADLTELSLAASASANTAKAIRGQMGLAELNAQERTELADLENRAFATYLANNLLSYASGELQKLKLLGGDTSVQETQLSTRQLTAETETAAQLRLLIKQKKWASALQLFSSLDSSYEKASMDRLDAEFQAPLSQYQNQIDTAIQQGKSAPPEVGYLQIKGLVSKYPAELNLQLALASVAQHAPPDHARLTDLTQVFRTFAKANKDAACQPLFFETQAKVTDELQQLDKLAAALAATKSGTPEQKKQLASLLARKEIYENRRIGSPDKDNPFSAAVNFFGKAVTGHTVVNNRPYFLSRQEKRDTIADVQSQIEQLKAGMSQPPEVVDQAQKNYDAFVAVVPWGGAN